MCLVQDSVARVVSVSESADSACNDMLKATVWRTNIDILFVMVQDAASPFAFSYFFSCLLVPTVCPTEISQRFSVDISTTHVITLTVSAVVEFNDMHDC